MLSVKRTTQSISVLIAKDFSMFSFLSPSCSVSCYKAHKEKCSAHPPEKTEPIVTEQKPLNLDEEEDVILTEKDLAKLKTNEKLMTMLRNKTLRKIIKEIDSSKYKKKALDKLENDPDFQMFTDEILNTLGFLKENRFVLPESK